MRPSTDFEDLLRHLGSRENLPPAVKEAKEWKGWLYVRTENKTQNGFQLLIYLQLITIIPKMKSTAAMMSPAYRRDS